MKRETVPRSTRGCVVVPCCGAARWVLMLRLCCCSFAEAANYANCLRFAVARLASIEAVLQRVCRCL